MFTLWGAKNPFCDGINRRAFLRAGALGSLGLADILRLQAQAGTDRKTAKSVIFVCLGGGPSHIDMYDLKPDAPADIRGDFKPIPTNVPGFDICEHFPLQARIADKLALVRTVQFFEPMQHELEEVYSGYIKAAGRPSFGSVISKFRPGHPELPSYVSLDYNSGTAAYESPQYMGAAHRPLQVAGNAGVRNLSMTQGMTRAKLDDRRELLQAFDNYRKDLDRKRESEEVDAHTTRAFDIITSPRARQAFDLTREPDKVRERYGTKNDKYTYVGKTYDTAWEGDKFLLARRLVEAGVSVVTLRIGSWDHHGNVIQSSGGVSIWYSLKSALPLLDRSINALVTDLHERGMDKDVLVVVWGEFGRTPKISQAGRDHWPEDGFALFAGGGLTTGQVIGETDSKAARPKSRPTTAAAVLATIYQTLGIDPSVTVPDFSGRPMYLLDDREPIAELF
ncbi:hypothetical protein AYO44_16350 [Planctomycetaceae bacterium SCGC AG-212-F19]|nr:hypothetical protein AYO44_16350 [Planctomycetaceae bacterium SCGC AG-212-F19]